MLADKVLVPFMPADASSEGIAAMLGMLPLIASALLCCEGMEPSIAVAIFDDPNALDEMELFVVAA